MPGQAGLIDRYLFAECRRLFLGLAGIVLAILLLERLIRIVELVANSDNAGASSARMIIDLVPHYLELAIPAALLLSMIIATDRLSRSGELVAMLAAGRSLRQLARPFLFMAAIAAAVSLLLTGFLQPLTRYDYRQAVHDLEAMSLRAAFQEGRFVETGDFTVWTDYRDFSGRTLGEIFILERQADGSERFISAPSGQMLDLGGDRFALQLDAGRGASLSDKPGSAARQRLEFNTMTWTMQPDAAAFRQRGSDERELMLFELGNTEAYPGVPQQVASASLHDRLSRALIILLLPFIAMPLGLNFGRRPKAGGIVFGVIILLVVQKTFESGFHMAAQGTIPAWAGSWPIVAATALMGAILFSRAAGEPLLPWKPKMPGLRQTSPDQATLPAGQKPV